jgi:hypothetical protein
MPYSENHAVPLDQVKLGVTPALSSSNTPAYKAEKDAAKVRNLEQMWANVDSAADQVKKI